ncbi:hypothetical protein G6F37_010594 [Rhizopus arrhizus]|nr:hypothetical protein G6F38_001589 [Rhizopus arrhizus]KAG1153176.1 hypothetical protein G6F37_010594 [Rhizopus arrhizus]
MKKDLQGVIHQLKDVRQEAESLSKQDYTAKDIQHLQNKLHHIDEQYREGIIDNRDANNLLDDPYENQDQAKIATGLAKVHNKLTSMLEKLQ